MVGCGSWHDVALLTKLDTRLIACQEHTAKSAAFEEYANASAAACGDLLQLLLPH